MSGLSLTGKQWHWPAPWGPHDAPTAGGLPPWASELLRRRGMTSAEEISRYLTPSLASIDDPQSLADMDKAAERLAQAVLQREPIVVYGDYDVDGVCSTALLVDFLRRVGGSVDYYIPHRRAEGYGLNPDAVRNLSERSKCMVTTDCGITAFEEIALAKSLGVDVIVVDHHRVPEQLPPALANLNPQRADCAYPFKPLCAAGVAFLLAGAVRRTLRDRGAFAARPEPDIKELLDLVALATVADMVPIRGTNRILVAAGLKALASTQRAGLQALMKVAGVQPKTINTYDLGFRLGPRINARGRMEDAQGAVELMITRDPSRAEHLAAELNQANIERRQVERETLTAAIHKIETEQQLQHAGLVVVDPSWHPGVLGLVASRLVHKFHRPALVIGEGGKGSGRGVDGLDLHAAIAHGSNHLIRFGGHKAAAGVTIDFENVGAFSRAFTDAVQSQLGQPPFVPILKPDLEISGNDLQMPLLHQIERLGPFGQENPEPTFVVRSLPVRTKRVVASEHLKLSLGDAHLDGIAFGLGHLLPHIPECIDVAFKLEANTFRGSTRLQLRVEDLRAAS